jgi:hypothetical protein
VKFVDTPPTLQRQGCLSSYEPSLINMTGFIDEYEGYYLIVRQNQVILNGWIKPGTYTYLR